MTSRLQREQLMVQDHVEPLRPLARPHYPSEGGGAGDWEHADQAAPTPRRPQVNYLDRFRVEPGGAR
jgi:hypothetical protein